MMRQQFKFLQLPFLLFVLIVFSRCANIVTPMGGPVDREPPIVVSTVPPTGTTGFDDQEIQLNFNEYISLANAAQEVMISPPIEGDLVVRGRGRSVFIELPEYLAAETTYSITFGKAIQDLTESNVLTGFRYVFSTGDEIDTLMVNGSVINALTMFPEEDVLVGLHPLSNDSSIFLNRPQYIAKSQSGGTFTIEHVKPGNYRLFALRDINNNMLYDLPGEEIGFIDTSVVLTSDAPVFTSNLLIFREQSTVPRFLSAKALQPGSVSLIYNQPVSTVSIDPVSENVPAVHHILQSFSSDTVKIWFDKIFTESVSFIARTENSVDTVRVTPSFRTTPAGVLQLRLKSAKIVPGNPVVLENNFPLQSVDSQSIKLISHENSEPVQFNITIDDSLRNRLIIQPDINDTSTHHLVLGDSAISSIYGQVSDSVSFSFSYQTSDELGNLIVNISGMNPEFQYIIQLLSGRDNSLQDQFLIKGVAVHQLSIPALTPEQYQIRIIEDVNYNLKWDSGNYLENRQPERVIAPPGQINVRANWDTETEVNVSEDASRTRKPGDR